MIGKNNPLNLRYVPNNNWKGQIGQTKGFCDFDTLEHGLRAVMKLIIVSYRRKGVTTISDIINRYAPKKENNTPLYIKYVCDKCYAFPFDEPSCRSEWVPLFWAMSQIEGNPVSIFEIGRVYDKYFDKNKGK